MPTEVKILDNSQLRAEIDELYANKLLWNISIL